MVKNKTKNKRNRKTRKVVKKVYQPNKDYYNGLKALSYNAIFSLIITNRNYGKTWAFQRRAFRRAIKHHKRTIWLRTFKKEVKVAVKKLYQSSDLQRYCGIVPYNSKTKKGNFKKEGNTFYYRKNVNGGEFYPFMEVYAVSDSNALRSADNVDTDTIIYDEFTTTIDKQNRYRGSVVTDFIDAFVSAKREHIVRCFFLGNKEAIRNPFLVYFKLSPLPLTFDGIRSYKEGSIIIEQRNNLPKQKSDYDKKLYAMLKDTAYGRYLEGAYKNAVSIKKHKTPPNALMYVQLDINGYKIRIASLDFNFYVSNSIDELRRVFVLKPINKYDNEILLIKRFKKSFITFINALADNRVYYDNETTYEAIQPFYEWLNF